VADRWTVAAREDRSSEIRSQLADMDRGAAGEQFDQELLGRAKPAGPEFLLPVEPLKLGEHGVVCDGFATSGTDFEDQLVQLAGRQVGAHLIETQPRPSGQRCDSARAMHTAVLKPGGAVGTAASTALAAIILTLGRARSRCRGAHQRRGRAI